MKEEEIRPKKLFDEYMRLAALDVDLYFEGAESVAIDCPACNKSTDFAFEKLGFRYELCPNCNTLFVNPRPTAKLFSKYYQESASSKFWASNFYRETENARREKIWKPKARLINKFINEFIAENKTQVVDIGGGYGLFAEEMKSLDGKNCIVIEPGPDLAAVCRANGVDVIEKFLEDIELSDLPSGHKTFVSFELVEHLHDPKLFFRHLFNLMNSGDFFIFTTLSGIGVDIQALWENSKSVMPPYHLNFFNPDSIDRLLTGIGFSVIEITTPGKLDIDIMLNNKEYIKDRFWLTFINSSTVKQQQEMQSVISSSGWSSHMMTIVKKP